MQCKVGETQATTYAASRRHGFGFSVQDLRGAPLFTVVYDTEAESKTAEEAMRNILESAVDVSTFARV